MYKVIYKSVYPRLLRECSTKDKATAIEEKEFEDRQSALLYIAMYYGLELDRLANYSPDTNWTNLKNFIKKIDTEPIKLINQWVADERDDEREVVTIELKEI